MDFEQVQKQNIKRFNLVSVRSCIELRNVVSTIHTTIDVNNTIHTIHTIHTIDVDNTIVDTTIVIGVIV